MHLFYAPGLIGDQYTLDREESTHCLRVLRLKNGDSVHLTDGQGTLFRAELISSGTGNCDVRIIEKVITESPPCQVRIAVAPPKNPGRMDWLVEELTVAGVTSVMPVVCNRSERRVINSDRLNRIMVSAMKQSLRLFCPELEPVSSFSQVVNNKFDGHKFIACTGPHHRESLKALYRRGQNVLILIGPEGDFTPGEVDEATRRGFIPVTLGTQRFRTESAALFACHTIQLINQ